MESMRRKVIVLAINIALQESETNGKDYCDSINDALDEACLRLEVSRKEFIRMFL